MQVVKSWLIRHVDDWREVASEIFALIQAGPGDWIAIDGPMGVGKTTLIQAWVHEIDTSISVTSPTFDIYHQYSTPIPIIHYDLYRLGSLDQDGLQNIDWYAEQRQTGVTVVEWSSRMPAHVQPPKAIIALSFEIATESRVCELICS